MSETTMTEPEAETETLPGGVTKYYDPKQARRDLREFDADLTIDLMRQAGLYAWYSAQLVQAEAQYDRLEQGLELLEAKLDSVVRAEAVASGTKVTESQVKTKVALDPRVRTIKKRLIEAKAEVGYLKSTCIAFAQRKDMLVQLGLLRRKEEDAGGLSVRKSMQAAHEARRERLSSLDPEDF